MNPVIPAERPPSNPVTTDFFCPSMASVLYFASAHGCAHSDATVLIPEMTSVAIAPACENLMAPSAELLRTKQEMTMTKMTIKGTKANMMTGLLGGLSAGITGFILYCSYTVAFLVGTEQVAADAAVVTIIRCLLSGDPNCRVTGAIIMCCIYGVILCATFFGLMAPGIQSINLGRSAAGEVFSTIQHVPGIDLTSKAGRKLEKLEGGLELRDVFFSYPTRPQDPIFYDFNLTIKPGQSMALVGPSGSGKSTIAKLLLRFYDPSKGDVLVDGVSLRDINVKWWRSQVGYVSQRPTLFPGTIRYNIACGIEGREATDAEVFAAAKAACADGFIRDMPDGYNTFYSGTSLQLSGAQMQRISIARAIISNPAILLLDEVRLY